MENLPQHVAHQFRTKQQRLDLLLENLQDYALIVTDLNGVIEEWNAGAQRITGFTETQALGAAINLLFTAEDVANGVPADEMEKARRDGKASDRRWHLRSDGRLFFADGLTIALRAAEGELRGFAKLFRDITQQHQADLALLESRGQLQAVFDSAQEGIYVMGTDTRCTYINRAGAKMLGYEPDQLVGRALHDVIHHTHPDGSHHPISECPIAIAMQSGGTASVEDDVFWRQDGRPVPVAYSVAPVVFDGHAKGAVVTYRNMTAMKAAAQAQEKLLGIVDAERLRLEEIFQLSPSFMCVLSGPEHRFERANENYLRLAGHRELLNRTVREAFPEVVDQGFVELLDGVYRSGDPYFAKGIGVQLHQPDGSVEQHHLDFTYQALRSPDGGIEGIFVQGIDLTDRIRAELENARLYSELKAQDRRKDEFIATLAHELRNPLAPIRSALAVMNRATSLEATAKMRQMMERQVTHIVRLIDDLMDVARITSGKVQLQLANVDLHAVLETALEVSKPLIEARRHGLFVAVPKIPIRLLCDPTRLAQVVSNVLNNAAKYTPDGGRIELSAELEADTVVIRVQDNGAGLPIEMKDQVFELFTQVGKTVDRAQGGLGIGLALVKRLVQMHGGTVEAQSKGLGHGSTFVIKLPVIQEPALLAGTRHEVESRGIRPARIMVVDDNVDAAESLAAALSLTGHVTSTCHSGPQALELFAAAPPEVVLLDIGLPGMDGYEVARELRRRHPGTEFVLMALTGWGTDADKQRAELAGFDEHFTKPVVVEQVEAAITRRLARPDMPQAL